MYMPIVGSRLKIHYDSVICYLSFFLVGPGISLVWGNVDPRFFIIYDNYITHLNICFIIFLHILCHADHYSAQVCMNLRFI